MKRFLQQFANNLSDTLLTNLKQQADNLQHVESTEARGNVVYNDNDVLTNLVKDVTADKVGYYELKHISRFINLQHQVMYNI